MENQNPRVPPLWEHSLTTLLGHDPTSDPGIALRQWVHFQGVQNILDLLSWNQEELNAVPAHQVLPGLFGVLFLFGVLLMNGQCHYLVFYIWPHIWVGGVLVLHI